MSTSVGQEQQRGMFLHEICCITMFLLGSLPWEIAQGRAMQIMMPFRTTSMISGGLRELTWTPSCTRRSMDRCSTSWQALQTLSSIPSNTMFLASTLETAGTSVGRETSWPMLTQGPRLCQRSTKQSCTPLQGNITRWTRRVLMTLGRCTGVVKGYGELGHSLSAGGHITLDGHIMLDGQAPALHASASCPQGRVRSRKARRTKPRANSVFDSRLVASVLP
mmetsp:Transcript_7764/g.28409  ORF Transcript_7764/g.28409 Transcript_7764/m.28409 type:complete len:221 (+) Transcript_7764:240-902(+)